MLVQFGQLPFFALFVGCFGAAIAPQIAAAADPVSIEAVMSADFPSVLIRPTGKQAVSIPACRGVVWQRFDADANSYIPISNRACPSFTVGVVLPDEGRTFEVDAPIKEGEIVRAVVVTGVGCTPALPFPMASCKSVVAVEGPTITVRKTSGR